jgi:hypothetical protein
MYAKLVVGPSIISAVRAMRDIGRLITSANPSVDLLTAFNKTSSIIIDPTPAGWTYVGGVNAADQPSIAAVDSTAATTSPYGYTNDTHYNLAFSAPCLNNPSRLKYALLSLVWRGTTTSGYTFALTAAQSVTPLGIATNEGPRPFAAAAEGIGETNSLAICTAANFILHVIASPRHITIIVEGSIAGLSAVWEATNTDVHDFYNKASFIQYSHAQSSATARFPIISPTGYTLTQSPGWMAIASGVTNVNTGTYYGTYDISEAGTANLGNLAQASSSYRNNSINAAGSPKYQIGPVYFQIGELGYPTQFVTGIVPIYWTRGNIGSTGDELEVGGDSYMFFNCGSGFGVIMKTD